MPLNKCGVPRTTCVEFLGQAVGVCSLRLSSSQGSNSDGQAWQQVPLSAEPSHANLKGSHVVRIFETSRTVRATNNRIPSTGDKPDSRCTATPDLAGFMVWHKNKQ